MNSSPEAALQELELKINISLRLLARFASLNRRWPANPIYLDLIRGIEAHLEHWEVKRKALKQPQESTPVGS
ncbi:MAG: hypothetical protein HYZ13_12550 [Acidobacteria bacterium]|nr:hypothetical protein [Acidobacteriota bacterium]